MSILNLQQLIVKAGEMAMSNNWSEKSYKINMAILKRDSSNAAAYTRLAKYYKMNGNIEEAKRMYLKTLEIDPNNRGAQNNLMEIEKDQSENEYIQKITSITELLKEGQKCMLKGKYNLASKYFSRAYSIEPVLSYAVNLAEAYKKMGKHEEIETLYIRIVELNTLSDKKQVIDKEFEALRAHA